MPIFKKLFLHSALHCTGMWNVQKVQYYWNSMWKQLHSSNQTVIIQSSYGTIIEDIFELIAMISTYPAADNSERCTTVWWLIRGILTQSCSAGAKNFTKCVFHHAQFSGVIQNIAYHRAIFTLFVYVDYYQNNQFY